jgi:hypothetical protein
MKYLLIIATVASGYAQQPQFIPVPWNPSQHSQAELQAIYNANAQIQRARDEIALQEEEIKDLKDELRERLRQLEDE